MNSDDFQTMMKPMMDRINAMAADEKAQACAAVMPQMMSTMMQGMMGGGEHGPAQMRDMMSKMMAKMTPEKKPGGDGQQMSNMPQMMLKVMMPHCVEMMLPAIDPDQRADAVGPLVDAIVEKGTEGMDKDQRKALRKSLKKALKVAN